MTIRPYQPSDLPAMTAIWNEVVEEGVAFPQLETLDEASGERFFAAQTHTAVAVDDAGAVRGLYILHPNNVGRCGHIANASFAVSSLCRGQRLGEALVKDCLRQARACGFTLMQFQGSSGPDQLGCPGFRRSPGRHPRRLPHEGRPLRNHLPVLPHTVKET